MIWKDGIEGIRMNDFDLYEQEFIKVGFVFGLITLHYVMLCYGGDDYFRRE